MVKTELQWQAKEHDDSQKSRDWFGVVTVAGVAGAVLAIIFNNVLLAVLVVVATLALLLEGLRKPRVFDFGVDTIGIHAGTAFYPYDALESFWIEEHEHASKLLLKAQKVLVPLIAIPLADNIDRDTLRTLLLEKLTEEPMTEPFFERVLRRFGF